MIVGERWRQELERIDARRNGQCGGSEGVIEEDHPARQKTEIRIEDPRDPGVRRTRALIPAIQPLVGKCDAEHRNEAQQDGHRAAIAARGNQARKAHRESLRRARAREPEDDGISEADLSGVWCGARIWGKIWGNHDALGHYNDFAGAGNATRPPFLAGAAPIW